MNNRYIPIALLFILAVVVIVLGVWPSYQEFGDLNNQEDIKRAEVRNRELYIENLKEIEALLNDRSSEVAKLDVVIPNSSEVPLLYNLLQKISSGSGLLFREVSSSAKDDESSSAKLNKISVSMIVEGSYIGVKELLTAARKAERFLDIKTIDFTLPEDDGKPIKFLIEVDSFSY